MKYPFYTLLGISHGISLYFGYYFTYPIILKVSNAGEAFAHLSSIVLLLIVEVCFAIATSKALSQIIAQKWKEVSTYNYLCATLLLGAISAISSILGVEKTPYFRSNAPQVSVQIPTPELLSDSATRAEYKARIEAIDKGFLATSYSQIEEKQSAKVMLMQEEARTLRTIDSTNRTRTELYLKEKDALQRKAQSEAHTDKAQAMSIAGFVLFLTAFLQWFLAFEKNISQSKKIVVQSTAQSETEVNQSESKHDLQPINQDYERFLQAKKTAKQIVSQSGKLEHFESVLVAIMISDDNTTKLQKDMQKVGVSYSKFYELIKLIRENKEGENIKKLRIA